MRDFQEAIAAMYERCVNEALATLGEPRYEPSIESRRIVGMLVETIAGYAAGSTTRELARTVHAWFGAELAALVHAVAPGPRARRATTRDELDVDDELARRPQRLREEFAEQLRTRLAETARDLAALVEGVAARLPGDRKRAAAAMFGELARTARYDDRLAQEIAIGWGCACAAIEHTPMPLIAASPRARDLWQIWSELVGNPSPSETRQPAERDGYIALVG
jgi:hypothetical protein